MAAPSIVFPQKKNCQGVLAVGSIRLLLLLKRAVRLVPPGAGKSRKSKSKSGAARSSCGARYLSLRWAGKSKIGTNHPQIAGHLPKHRCCEGQRIEALEHTS